MNHRFLEHILGQNIKVSNGTQNKLAICKDKTRMNK